MLYKGLVNFLTPSKRQRGLTRCAATGLMFGLWLTTLLLAASPELHRLLHSDAQNPDHHCLVTQVKEHSVFSASATICLPVLPSSIVVALSCSDFPFVAAGEHRLSPSRAPPILSLP